MKCRIEDTSEAAEVTAAATEEASEEATESPDIIITKIGRVHQMRPIMVHRRARDMKTIAQDMKMIDVEKTRQDILNIRNHVRVVFVGR